MSTQCTMSPTQKISCMIVNSLLIKPKRFNKITLFRNQTNMQIIQIHVCCMRKGVFPQVKITGNSPVDLFMFALCTCAHSNVMEATAIEFHCINKEPVTYPLHSSEVFLYCECEPYHSFMQATCNIGRSKLNVADKYLKCTLFILRTL